jgi:ERCC4-related helicase
MAGGRGGVWALQWQRVLGEHQVVVCTGQVLLNLLDKGAEYMSLERVALLVIDECHNTVKKHPYNKIMQKLAMAPAGAPRPRIFALTVRGPCVWPRVPGGGDGEV